MLGVEDCEEKWQATQQVGRLQNVEMALIIVLQLASHTTGRYQRAIAHSVTQLSLEETGGHRTGDRLKMQISVAM